jgi:hypothetical protein
MNLKLISCDVLYREMCSLVAQSPHRVDTTFLPKGLHDLPSEQMRARLQDIVDAVPEQEYDAIIMGYGLCNNGLHGVEARHTPLVLPRAHDCITLFFGSRQKYMAYFEEHHGVYFLTSGWIERGTAEGELKQLSIGHINGMDMTYEEMEEKYGEDNAQFLFETLVEAQEKAYRQYTFIEMGLETDAQFEAHARERALEKDWSFAKVKGDLSLIKQLVRGEWDPGDFLYVKPGQRIIARYDDGVVRAE